MEGGNPLTATVGGLRLAFIVRVKVVPTLQMDYTLLASVLILTKAIRAVIADTRPDPYLHTGFYSVGRGCGETFVCGCRRTLAQHRVFTQAPRATHQRTR